MSHKSSICSDVLSFSVRDKWEVWRERKRLQYNSLGHRKYLDYLISHIDEETIQLLARIENLDQPIVEVVVSVEAYLATGRSHEWAEREEKN